MPGLTEHVPQVDTAKPTVRGVHCNRMEPSPHRLAEGVIRCPD